MPTICTSGERGNLAGLILESCLLVELDTLAKSEGTLPTLAAATGSYDDDNVLLGGFALSRSLCPAKNSTKDSLRPPPPAPPAPVLLSRLSTEVRRSGPTLSLPARFSEAVLDIALSLSCADGVILKGCGSVLTRGWRRAPGAGGAPFESGCGAAFRWPCDVIVLTVLPMA